MIIGLHGKKRSGKDTVYGLLKQYHDGRVIRKAFADPLKLSACRLFYPDCTVEEALVWADQMKEDGFLDMTHAPGEGAHVSGREFLQRFGTEAHREVFGKNFWVDASLPRFDGMGNSELCIFGTRFDKDFVVFTDVRFPNEAERVREWGGEVWEVQRTAVETGDEHASEQRLPPHLLDCTLYNNGSLEELEIIVKTKLEVRKSLPGLYPNG